MTSGFHLSSLSRGIGAVLALFILCAAPASAQDVQQQLQQQVPDSVQELMAEFQEKQVRLQGIQQQALEGSEELQEREAELEEWIESEMRAIEPDMDSLSGRLEAMEAEAQTAQASQDQERLQEIMAEAQGTVSRLQTAQMQVLERDDVQEELEQYQNALLDEMKSLDPEVDQLVERLEELAMVLQSMQGPGGPGGPR